jgi:sulfatase modifying factor 1
MVMKRCDQGHDYDAGKHSMCPVCGGGVPDSDIAALKSSDDFFTQAWDEINDQNKTPNKALWAKAFAFAQGDEKRTQAKYIELRVSQLETNYLQLKEIQVQANYAASCIPFTDSETGMEFIFVKGGCFDMGDTYGDGFDDEKPVHEVCLSDFHIGKYPVTQGQWKAIMRDNPSHFQDCGDNFPVENISWNDVQEFIRTLNNKSGKKYRLPTEAEWEYAARSGGKKEKYAGTSSSDNDLGEYAWYEGNAENRAHPVGQKKPNGLGLYDMSGNVWEWVEDVFGNNYYRKSPRDNPRGPGSGGFWRIPDRVIRGGSFNRDAHRSRATIRSGEYQDGRFMNVGFRLSASVLQERIAIDPENITQQKQPKQEQESTAAMTKGAFVPPKSSPQESAVFAAPTEKPRQLMSSRVNKGKSWFKWVLYILGAASVVKLLFAFGHNDPGKKITESLFFFFGGLILFGGGAFVLGWLTGAAPDSKKNTDGVSN